MTDRRPETLAGLVEALTRLPSLDPVERARACPCLIEAAKHVLARERADAMLQATAPGRPGRITQVELAVQLGIVRSAVTDAIKLARR